MSAGFSLSQISLRRDSDVPLHRQLYVSIRDAILEGQIGPGTRLASTRMLAAELGVGRNTVISAFEQLLAEGFLDSHVGAGTHVVDLFPQHPAHALTHRATNQQPLELSRRGALLARTLRSTAAVERAAFAPGLPALDRFPFATWNRLLARHQRQPRASDLGYEHGAGHPELRHAIAQYLRRSRGVDCTADQVIVVAGAQAALDLAARMLIDAGDDVWLEEPGYLGARGAFLAAGARIVSVPIDDEGISVDAGRYRSPRARLAYVTPSFQYPTGVTMSLERRLALLEWAQRYQSWVIEDDYDSEYRFRGRPLSALQGIDAGHRVLYTGTFSKTLYPALRIGYLVVPRGLESAFEIAIRHTGHTAALLPQRALAEFMSDGSYVTHLRRMRGLYARRQQQLLDTVNAVTGGRYPLPSPDGGMQVPLWLTHEHDDRRISKLGAEQGLTLSPLSDYHMQTPKRPGLYLGFAGASEEEIHAGVVKLAQLLS